MAQPAQAVSLSDLTGCRLLASGTNTAAKPPIPTQDMSQIRTVLVSHRPLWQSAARLILNPLTPRPVAVAPPPPPLSFFFRAPRTAISQLTLLGVNAVTLGGPIHHIGSPSQWRLPVTAPRSCTS
jgi:hypothetical protein